MLLICPTNVCDSSSRQSSILNIHFSSLAQRLCHWFYIYTSTVQMLKCVSETVCVCVYIQRLPLSSSVLPPHTCGHHIERKRIEPPGKACVCLCSGKDALVGTLYPCGDTCRSPLADRPFRLFRIYNDLLGQIRVRERFEIRLVLYW